MKFVALVSGGKDSCYNILHCLAQDHELVAMANLYPEQSQDEIDSFMFQTVGHDILSYYSECVGIPMYRQKITGTSKNQTLEYTKTQDDEIEDLFQLLSTVLEKHPDVQGVSVGAILSSYQRTRVEDVCSRLGLTSLAYLWQRDQNELMQEMCGSGLDARIIKVAAMGLDGSHLGMSINQLYPILYKLNERFDVHICGEGGEFESLVLDAPFFKKKLEIVKQEVMDFTNDGVYYLRLAVEVAAKDFEEVSDWKKTVVIPPLLAERFHDMLQGIKKVEYTDAIPEPVAAYKQIKRPSVKQIGNTHFFSNIISAEPGLEDQCKGVFSQLAHLLEIKNLSFAHIQSSTLLVSSMTTFSSINRIYCEYFKEPLPPSRICVETNLPHGIHLQLSVSVISNIQSKRGLHVQGRSYWAPANIGPYSQAIIDENNIATLAGQIPLVPANMELLTDDEGSLSTVLSLQHLDNVKTAIDCPTNASVVSFVTEVSYITKVCDVWSRYGTENLNTLIIVQVTSLPRAAKVEWGGLSYKEVRDMYYDSDDDVALDATTKAVHDRLDCNNSLIKINNVFVSTMFYNVDDIPKLDERYHHQVYATPCSFEKLSSLNGIASIEYVPVTLVWDHMGISYDFGIVIRGEL